MTHNYDAFVVGAGAAGLFVAIFAAEWGRRVLLLEKGRKAGVKILMSGGTRCNITHDCDNRGIVEANGRFLHSAPAAKWSFKTERVTSEDSTRPTASGPFC